MRIASLLRILVLGGRKLLGRSGSIVECRRDEINWRLDLNEGIDLAIYIFSSFERSSSTRSALSRFVKEGMIAFDIGANIGAYALPLAKCVGTSGRLYAFEPTDWAYSKLSANFSLNADLQGRSKLLQMALGEPGELKPKEFFSSWDLRITNETHPVLGGVSKTASGATMLSLDEYVKGEKLSHIDFIKLDVDGFEMQVLKGAKKVFNDFKPTVLFELCLHVLEEHNSSGQELLSFFEQFGYSFFVENERVKRTKDELIALVPNNGSINIIAKV